MTWVLIGPMTGWPEFNYPAFEEAAIWLRGVVGLEVASPTETDASHDWKPGEHDPMTLPAEEYRRPLRWAMRRILEDDVEGGICLPSWATSNGARVEALTVATLRLPLLQYPTLDLIHPTRVAIAIDGPALPLPVGCCPRCHGDGTVTVRGYSHNPNCGFATPDPQADTDARCDMCHGAGELTEEVFA